MSKTENETSNGAIKESKASVQRVRDVGGTHQQLDLAIEQPLSAMKPGQVLLARPSALRAGTVWDWHPYTRWVWHPVHFSPRIITVELPRLQTYEAGDTVDLIGPVGKPYVLRKMLHNVMLIAYDTPPVPLFSLIPFLFGNNISVTLVLLGSARHYPTNHLPPEVEIIRGENPDEPLTWPDQVKSIGWADRVFAAVPPGDEMITFGQLWHLFSERRGDLGAKYLYGVFQSLLPCGVGACDGCMVRTKNGLKLACVDGPAMDLSQMILP